MNAPDRTVHDDDRAARSRALDDFAQVPTPARNNSIVPQMYGAPAERVFGAVNVAVLRDEARVLSKLKTLAAAAGADWYYRFPVKKKGGGTDWIEGPSIKLANDVARIYGNCDVDCRAMDLGDSWVFHARFTDFETGYTLTRPFQQRKSQRAMNTDNDRALDIAFQIGASKAIRNVVANALQTFADYAFEEAKNSLVEKIGKDVGAWRDRTLKGLANIPVEVARAEAMIGRAAKDWLAPDIGRVIAIMKSIADGMASADEAFPPVTKPEEAAGEQTATEKPDAQKGSGEAAGGGAAPQTSAAAEASAQSSSPRTGVAPDAAGKPAPTAAATEDQQAAGAGKAADGDKRPAAKAEKKAAAGQEAKTTAPDDARAPTNEAEYVAFAEAWIAAATNPDEADARWKAEKGLRNKANVSSEVRDQLQRQLHAKIRSLPGGSE